MQRLNRTWLMIGLAAASAALTFLLYTALQPDRTPVVVAVRDLEPFSPIQPEDLTVIQVEKAAALRLFPDAFQRTQELDGLMTLRRIRANEALRKEDPGIARQEQLADVVAAQNLPISYMIPERYRAVPVTVRLPGAAPGDFVEFYTPGNAKPVLNRPAQVVTNQGGSLLVLVTKQDVEPLLTAQIRGDLQAVLTTFPLTKEETPWSG